VVRVTHAADADASLVRVQSGIVEVSKAAVRVAYADSNRDLERWLLATGQRTLKKDVIEMVERGIR